MAGVTDFTDIKAIVSGLDNNKVAKFAYTDAAFAADTVDGVVAFNVAAEQNVPTKDYTDVNATVLDKGIRTQGASLPRMLINHFFGRVSYNLNKLINKFASFISFFLVTLAHNCAEYDANAGYLANDSCYLITNISGVLSKVVYRRISTAPTSITGVNPSSSPTDWAEVVASARYGIGASKLLTSVNLDNVRPGQTYAAGALYGIGSGCTNMPAFASGAYGTLLVIGYDANNCIQLWFDQNTASKACGYRIYASGWAAWEKIWNSFTDGPGSGLDADTVSGYGIGTAAKVLGDNYNFNTTQETGFYQVVTSPTNGPGGNYWWMLQMNQVASGYQKQIVFNQLDSTQIYFRSKIGGTWDATWQKVWNSGNDGPGSGLDADTVSGYGIGVEDLSVNIKNVDLDTLRLGGFYRVSYGAGFHFPAGVTVEGQLFVWPDTTAVCTQLFRAYDTGKLYMRYRVATWSAWRDMFDADTVSGYGIGGVSPTNNSDLNAIVVGGFYFANYGAGRHYPAVSNGQLIVVPGNTGGGYCNQIFFSQSNTGGNYIFCRQLYGGTPVVSAGTDANGWSPLWNGFNDGPGSGLDADTATGSGIGGGRSGVTDLHAITGDGVFFRSSVSPANAPTAGYFYSGFQIYTNADVDYRHLFVFRSDGAIYTKKMFNATWETTWQCISDGLNGSTAPAPKPSVSILDAAMTIPSGTNTGSYLLSNSAAAARIFTLPLLSTEQVGTRLTFKNKSPTYALTVTANVSDRIGSYAGGGGNSFVLYAEEDYVVLETDGQVWNVVATNGPVQRSIQSSTKTTAVTSWAAIGNGFSLGTLPPGVYDFELEAVGYSVGYSVGVAIGNNLTPISCEAAILAPGTRNAVFRAIKGYVLASASIIQGIYYSDSGSSQIGFGSNGGSITARRIG
jgi:hypothetical protein